MFCAPGVVFRGTEGVGSRFHVLRSQTHFRRYRERRVQLLCFARPDLFSAEPRASAPVFIFCVPELVSHGTEGVGSCFNLPDSFSAVRMVPGPVFVFYAPALVYGHTEGIGSRFHVLHSRAHFWLYRGRRFSFSCFTRPNSFSQKQMASSPVFIF
jgi:hypothetical protein